MYDVEGLEADDDEADLHEVGKRKTKEERKRRISARFIGQIIKHKFRVSETTVLLIPIYTKLIVESKNNEGTFKFILRRAHMPSFSLLPSQTKFFDLFEQAGDNLLEGARLLQDLLDDYVEV